MIPLSKTDGNKFPSPEGRGKVHLEFQERIFLDTRKDINDIGSRLDDFLEKEGIQYSIASVEQDSLSVEAPWYHVGFGSALKHKFHFLLEKKGSQLSAEITVFRLEPSNYIALSPESVKNWKFFVLRVLMSIPVDISKDLFFKLYDQKELDQLKKARNSKWVIQFIAIILLFVNLFPKPVWIKIIEGDLLGVVLINGVFFFLYLFISRLRSQTSNVDLLIERYSDL